MPRAIITGWIAILIACTRTGSEAGPDDLDVSDLPPPTATAPVPLHLPLAMRDHDWISIERTACYGACPQFTITATAAGSVEWVGVKDVNLVGVDYRVVDAAALAEIYAGFAGLDWLEIPQWSRVDNDDDCSTDAPTTIVTLGRGRVSRALRHYHGCGSEELRRMGSLETQLLELVAAQSWLELGEHAIPSSDAPCPTMAFRPVFSPLPPAKWTSFTDTALSIASRSMHQGADASKIFVVAVDDGKAELASAVSTLGVAVARRLHAFDSDLEVRVVPPAPKRPAPGEIRMLIAPVGCPSPDVDGGGW